ncbi:DMT family transporter, partial [Ferrovibrio sp.]
MLYERIFGSGNRRGILAMSLGIILFVVNEALCKLVFATVPTSQVMAVRGGIALLLILAAAHATGATRQIAGALDRGVLMRSLADLFGSYLYMFALFQMPIGNMMAINMASPLMMTATVALLLREPVGWRRWSAVVAGFIGVLLVVQPRAESFNAYSLVAVAAVCCLVVRDLVTRAIAPGVPSLIVILTNVGMMAAVTSAAATVEGWVPMGWYELLLLGIAAVFIAAGYLLVVDAFRHAEVPVIVPLRYTGLLWALLIGWLVWGDVPNEMATAGILLIVASGLYVLHRERVRGRVLPPADPPGSPA